MPERVGLGEFELLVLAAVLSLGTEAYGSAVYRELDRTGRPVSMGAVYTTLHRLEEKGMLRSHEGDPTPVRGGRAKRFFHLERAGHAALSESLGTLAALLDGTELAFGAPS
ncbi:MAG: helix-turn-helix transcriptional regulator [Longimicrobiales bacterium]